MQIKDEKQQKLIQIATMYYLENQKQSDIAHHFGISRPLVSRMLQEARDLGIVEINIRSITPESERVLAALRDKYGLRGGALVAEDKNDSLVNHALAEQSIQLLDKLKTKRLGLGWGHMIGQIVSYLEQTDADLPTLHTVCPMIGNSGMPIRHYQSAESVRVFAEKLHASPHFLNLPALPIDCAEKDVFCGTESYRQVYRQWERMDTAFVNIGNYPSTPDFASGARYGVLLQRKHACGRVIAYFVNREGEVIESDQDFVLQIPLYLLNKCKNVVGLCSANTSAAALEGALHTGMFTHLIARENLAKEIV